MHVKARRGTSKPTRRGPSLGVSKSRVVKTAGGQVGQWFTPPWLAELLVHWSLNTGDRVLDAGAGRGALTTAALSVLNVDVVAIESDPRHAAYLERELGDRVRVVTADFLERDTRTPGLFDSDSMRGFDVCIQNPPWEQDLPEQFLIRACELADRCCAIVPLNLLCGGKRSTFWRGAPIEPVRAKALAQRPRFLGTKGGMRDVMLLEVRPRLRGSRGPVSFEMEVG